MTTEQVILTNEGKGMEKALETAEKFALYYELDKRQTLHLRLLTEETLGMVRAIAGEYKALFWLEGEKRKKYIHLLANTNMNIKKREGLLAVSSSGKNEAAKGIMGKIRDMFEYGMENYEAVGQMQVEQGMGYMMYGSMGMDPTDTMTEAVMAWSLQQYRTNLDAAGENSKEESDLWDELEKSIVANIADDVKVWIRKDQVEMVIEKRM